MQLFSVDLHFLCLCCCVSWISAAHQGDKCDRTSTLLLPLEDKSAYLYCGLNGVYKQWRCKNNTEFDRTKQGCVELKTSTTTATSKLNAVVTTTESNPLKPLRYDAVTITEGDKCNADQSTLYPTSDSKYYLFCGLSGVYTRWRCPGELLFSKKSKKCLNESSLAAEELLSHPARQDPRVAQVCPNGQLPFLLPNSNSLVSCSTETANNFDCPAGYRCFAAPGSTNYVTGYCCSSSTNSLPVGPTNFNPSVVSRPNQPPPVNFQSTGDFCPVGSQPYVSPNRQPISCNSPAACPPTHDCVSGFIPGVNFCCTKVGLSGFLPSTDSLASSSLQPQSKVPQVAPCALGTTIASVTSSAYQLLPCMSIGPSTCPSPAICQPSLMGLAGFCCLPVPKLDILSTSSPSPPGFNFDLNRLLDNVMQTVLISSLNNHNDDVSNSPNPNRKGRNETLTNSSIPVSGCGFGRSPFLNSGQPQYCSLNNPTACPPGYFCETVSLATAPPTCCGNPIVNPSGFTESGCPSGQILAVDPSTQQASLCGPPPSPNSCPAGFTCVFSATRIRYQCCGSSETVAKTPLPTFGCPLNTNSFINPSTGQPQICSLNSFANPCPAGYQCQISTQLNSPICCSSIASPLTSNAGACPSGLMPLTANGAVLQCSFFQNCPPSFSCFPIPNSQISVCCPSPTTTPSPGITQVTTSQCPVGEALMGVTCDTSLPCPSGYDCVRRYQGSYCCPNKVTLCTQPQSAGTSYCPGGNLPTLRYSFSTSMGNCQTFVFSGCGGNGNNFNSLESCESTCLSGMCRIGSPMKSGQGNMGCANQNSCPNGYSCEAPIYGSSFMRICCPTASTVCSLPIQPGNSCKPGDTTTTIRFYYNLQSRSCQQFAYAGCGGNDNSFASLNECSQFCGQFSSQNLISNTGSCPDGRQQLPGVSCSISAAYSCPTGYVCQMSTTNTAVCCLAPMNFGTCPDGQAPFSASGLLTPITCSPNILASCPSSHSCVQSTTGQPICCPGAQNVAPQCPLGYVPYFSVNSLVPLTCNYNSANPSCPFGYTCQPGSRSDVGVCCAQPTSMQQRCPDGNQPYYQQGTRTPQSCSVGLPFSCPSAYSCVQSGTTNSAPICCPGGTNSALTTTLSCPNGRPSLVIPGTSNSATCSMSGDSCPNGYVCAVTSNGMTACCQQESPVISQLSCVVGFPYFSPGSTTPQLCSISQRGSCPDDYSCTPATNGQTICCSSFSPLPNPATTASPMHSLCSSGSPYAAPGSRSPQYCSPSQISSCPSGYRCENSLVGGQFICCPQFQGSMLQCPVNYFPLKLPGTQQTQNCDPKSNSACPVGYVCSQSAGNPQSFLCCGLTAAVNCPAGQQNYLNPSTGLKQLCDPSTSTDCRGGSTCVPSNLFAQFICCSPTTVPPMCLTGSQPYMLPGTTTPMSCSTGSSCPGGYACQQSTVIGQYYCCQGKPVANPIPPTEGDYCPFGQKPLPTANGAPLECVANVANNCAIGYFCTLDRGRNKHYCCGTGINNDNQVCPIGQSPYILPSVNQQLTCSPTVPRSCPTGYDCTRNLLISSTTFYCCGSLDMNDVTLGEEIGWEDDPTSFNFTETPKNNSSRPLAHPHNPYEMTNTSAKNMTNIKSIIVEAYSEKNCSSGFITLHGKCRQLLWPGQTGCITNEQCSTLTPQARCQLGYCVCPNDQVVMGVTCVRSCPAGYHNLLGRCEVVDLFKVFEAIDEKPNRAKGLLKSACLPTVVPEKQCTTAHTVCNRQSQTCECLLGYREKSDVCVLVESTKLGHLNSGAVKTTTEDFFFRMWPFLVAFSLL